MSHPDHRGSTLAAVLVLILVTLLLTGSVAFAQEADLIVSARWVPACMPCSPGDTLTLVNTVTNLGPDTDFGVDVQMATPWVGADVVLDSWTTTQGGFDVDPQGNALWCDYENAVCGLNALLGEMASGSTATLTFDVVLDLTAPPSRTLWINEPPDLAQQIGPSDLGWPSLDWGIPPWFEWEVTGNAEWVNDGTGEYGEYGCFPLQGFTPGKIAMVFRGPLPPGIGCEFGLKAWNAQQAGAIGVIIVNHSIFGVTAMGSGTHGALVTIPTLMIPVEIGNTLHQRLAWGETVSLTFPGFVTAGPSEPWEVTTEGTGFPAMWAFGTADPDCCPVTDPNFPICCSLPDTDNLVFTRVAVDPYVLFTDGFESGDSSVWAFTLP